MSAAYKSPRTNPSQGFDTAELQHITEREAKRPLIPHKRDLNLVDFQLAEKWLQYVNSPFNPFRSTNMSEVVDQANSIKESIGSLTLRLLQEENKEMTQLIQDINSYLGKEDPLEKSDFIFVFGGKTFGRIQTGVELWKAGWAPKIWISGGHPVYQESESEAIIFKRWAMEQGVPEDVIFIEPHSITIADNVRRSLNAMDEMGVIFSKMILVMGWYAQKRAWVTMEKYMPEGKKLINRNAAMDEDNLTHKDRWYKTEYGINIVFNEFVKMKINEILIPNESI